MNKSFECIIPREKMADNIRKLRDFYDMKPDAPIIKREFGWFTLDKWREQGYLKKREEVADYNAYLNEIFDMEDWGYSGTGGLGWCEAALLPEFDTIVLEDLGDHELVQDFAGRKVLYFKGRRNGFMPEYVDHPVKDMKTWVENVKWRLDPKNPQRQTLALAELERLRPGILAGNVVRMHCIGGYMYLRSLMGPEDLLYKFYDEPQLIHDCMKTWFELADSVSAFYQKYIRYEEIFLGEDICYNHGSLISPDMIKEFLFPYYQQLYENVKSRNGGITPHFQIDTDGDCRGVIDLYKSIGMDVMSPFEVASGCDVVEQGRQYPDLRITGGIDKRILSADRESIDRTLDRIMPAMRKRGGFIPTCDHGVPEEVEFETYMYYRKRMTEYCD